MCNELVKKVNTIDSNKQNLEKKILKMLIKICLIPVNCDTRIQYINEK